MIPLKGLSNANLARVLLNHIHTGHHTSNVRRSTSGINKHTKTVLRCQKSQDSGWKCSFNCCCPLCWLVLDTRPTDGVRGHAGRSDWEWTDLLYWWHKRWWEDLELVSFMPRHFLSNWVPSACWNGYYWFPLKHCLSLFTYLIFFS